MRRRRSGLNFNRHKRKANIKLIKEVLVWMMQIALTILLAFTFVYFIGLRTSAVGQSMAETIYNGDNILTLGQALDDYSESEYANLIMSASDTFESRWSSFVNTYLTTYSGQKVIDEYNAAVKRYS